MSDDRRAAQLGQQVLSQNNTLKNTRRVAEELNDTSNQVLRELGDQRFILEENTYLVKNTRGEIRKVEKTTDSMRCRAVCQKLVLWVVAVLLFLTALGLLVYRLY
jgi:hypothetical protein